MELDDVQGDDFAIEDRRGQGGGGGGLGMGGGGFPIPMGKGAGGIGLILMVVLALFMGSRGGDGGGGGIGDVLGQLGGGQSAGFDEAPPSGPVTKDAQTVFVSKVGSLLNDYWEAQFKGSGEAFNAPRALVVFDAPTPTGGCGTGAPEAGPFYCPADQKIYIDFAFYTQLEKQLGFSGDFAMAYVLAHEYGHHVQNVLGITEKVGRSNEDSVRVELQADCFAGAWAKSAYEQNRLETGDFDEAIGAAVAVGDDAIQKKTQGSVDRDAWTHGSSADRQKWFRTGFDSGDPSGCNTFD